MNTAPIIVTPDLERRFWPRVDRSGDCWLWTGSRRHKYGEVIHQNQKLYAHRVAWTLVNGPIPPGGVLCHTCDVPLCVRPDHLFIGTQTDNIHDMWQKGRGSRPPYHQGATHPRAVLTTEQVVAIRVACAAGVNGRELAAQYAVTPQTVSGIVRGKTWRSVGGPLTGGGPSRPQGMVA